MYNIMVVIFTILLQTWPCQQNFSVSLKLMVYCIVNLCYVVTISVPVLSYPVGRKTKIQQTRIQQYVFMVTVMFHDLLCTFDVHTTNKQHVQCVSQFLCMTIMQRYTHKKNLCYQKHKQQNFTEIITFQPYKTGISFSACAYPRNSSLCQRIPLCI